MWWGFGADIVALTLRVFRCGAMMLWATVSGDGIEWHSTRNWFATGQAIIKIIQQACELVMIKYYLIVTFELNSTFKLFFCSLTNEVVW